ncbi:hypothetical protein TRIP_B330131 [uncultured Desulfatiglans sp.]|nr:hypothetical protein TRIP_B330131 [uncultured Desulfatiglans sp.]
MPGAPSRCLEEVESARRSLGLLKVLGRLLASISEGCGLDRRLLRAETADSPPASNRNRVSAPQPHSGAP